MNISQMRNLKKQGGFTLIELMIVIAILAILMAIAIPAYQDYTVRAQLSECISIVGGAKTFVAETASSQGELVEDGDYTNFTAPADLADSNCTSLSIDDSGVITVTADAGPGGDLTFTPTQAALSDSIEWACEAATAFEPNQLPNECRS